MGKTIQQLIRELPPESQAEVKAKSAVLQREMLAAAKSLDDLRKAVGKTQVEVAQTLGVKQNAVSQLEKRNEVYVSTLQKFVGALDMHLEVALRTKDGVRIEMPFFLGSDGPIEHAMASKVVSAARALRLGDDVSAVEAMAELVAKSAKGKATAAAGKKAVHALAASRTGDSKPARSPMKKQKGATA